MLVGTGKQRVELVGGRKVGGTVSACSTSSGIATGEELLSMSSLVFSNLLFVMRNSAIEGRKIYSQ